MKISTFIVPCLLLALGCSAAPAEPDASDSRPAVVDSSAARATAEKLAEKYAFSLDGKVTEQKVVRTTTFSTSTESISKSDTFGEITGFSRAGAPQMKRGWPSSMEEHDALARSWVEKTGIPVEEIGQISHWRGETSGSPVGSAQATLAPEHTGFSTTFTRVVQGYLVLESHAGVQLNRDGVATSFAIAWPAIPESVIRDARHLSNVLSRGYRLPEEYVANREVVGTTVVIRHSLPGSREKRIEAVLRTELRSGSMPTYVDTDEFGQRVELVETYSGGEQTK